MNQLAARIAGENRARLTMLQILCGVSIWRRAMTQLLPLCGAAAWWVTLACLLPGIAVAGQLRAVMYWTGAATMTEAIRVCLGKAGTAAVSCVLAALLILEGLADMTALMTLFTEGIGTRGTRFTLALLTGGALMLCLHREGLPRGMHLLRWGMAGAAVLMAVCLLPDARLDHIFPLYGSGDASVRAALKAGIGLSWPVALLLTVPPNPAGRLRRAVLPALIPAAALLLLALTIPQALLAAHRGLADWLLLPAKYASNALRILYLCLLMLTMLMSIGAAVHLASEQLCAPMKRRPGWIPYVLLTGLVLTQTGDSASMGALLSAVGTWTLIPLAGAALICLPAAILRRKCV